MSRLTPPSLALYVHWPFCVRKCPYCDFNSHVRAEVDQARWRAALLADLAHEAARHPGHTLTSIFFGGGTPSLMPPETVAAIIAAATAHWRPVPGLEVTLEANPSSVEAERFAAFADSGVNRVSLGLQALDDDALRLLGRPHDLAEGLRALEVAQRRFGKVSFDLIHSRPGQTVAGWEAELRRGLALGTGHLSAYQLTIEPGTRFQTLFREGRLRLPDEDSAAAMFELTADLCTAAGLPPYEISNHARAFEESRHNLTYWTYGSYAGIGPGAHGRRRDGAGRVLAVERHRRPERWLEAVAAQRHGIAAETLVDGEAAAREALMMGLRLSAGIEAETFARHTGVPLAAAIDDDARRRLVDWGLIAADGPLRATARGRPLLDRLVAELVPALKHSAAVAS